MTSVLASPCTWLATHGSSCVEAFGFGTGVLNVWLVTRQSLWSWPLGVLNAVFYAVVFARTGLYADTGLQGVYFVLSLYGWWYWWHGAASGSAHAVPRATRPVTKTPVRLAVMLGAVGAGTWLLLATVTARLPGAALPWLDAALVATSLVAQWMMTRKLLEHWLLWIAVDVIYVGLFINRRLPLTAVLYALFAVLSVAGWRVWRQRLREQAHG